MTIPITTTCPEEQPSRVPLLPRHGIYLTVDGHGDGRRFARIFLTVWKRLPLCDRRRILRHWRSLVDFRGNALPPPAVELCDMLYADVRDRNLRLRPLVEVFGRCDP